MSTETDNNPAVLAEGEPVIPAELAESLSNLKDKMKGLPEADENSVIGSSRTNAKGGKKKAAIGSTNNGAIGSVKTDAQAEKRAAAIKASTKVKATGEKVALFSTKNVTWSGVGSVVKGYNIVSKADSEKWLKRGHIRLATPQEIKEEYDL